MSDKYCILGAGPSGIATAYYLNQKGITDITILEKSDQIGGKAHTITEEGKAYDMGATEATPFYVIINSFIEQFGLNIEPIPPQQIVPWSGPGAGCPDPITCMFPDSDVDTLKVQFNDFFEKRQSLGDYLDFPGYQGRISGGQPGGIPDGLKNITLQQWLITHNLSALIPFFWVIITNFGYGYIDQIPAVYGLKFATVTGVISYMRQFGLDELIPKGQPQQQQLPPVYRLQLGYQHLMQLILDGISPPVNLQLQADVQRIERTPGPAGVIVHYRPEGGKQMVTEKFDKLVVAFPPLLKNLDFLAPITQKEKEMFGQVGTENYYTTFDAVNSFDWYLYELLQNPQGPVPADQLPHVLQFYKPWNGTQNMIHYSFSAAGTTPLTTAEVTNLAKSDVEGRGQQFLSSPAPQSFVWDTYSPTVDMDAVSNNYFVDLYKMQGENDTYWTSGMMNFEIVEKCFQYAQFMVYTLIAGETWPD